MARKNPKKQIAKPQPDQRNLWIPVVLAALCFIIYIKLWNHTFIKFDDDLYIYENAHVLKGLTAENIAYAFTDTTISNWLPLPLIGHMINVDLFGLNAGGHHLVSAFFHLINAVLLYFLLRKLTGAVWRSGILAALFAVHPMRIESVAWASELKDVLCALFWLLTMWAYVRYTEQKSTRRYLAMAGLFALALLSKPMAVTLPLVLILMDYWPLRRPFSLKDKLPLFAMSLAEGIITVVAQTQAGGTELLDPIPFPIRVANAILAYGLYLKRTFWPFRLSLIYPYNRNLPAWQVSLAALVLVVITFLVIRYRKQAPWAGVGWLWFLVVTAPTIGLLQAGYQANADRYTYLPHIGLLLMIVWAAAELIPKPAMAPVAAAAIIFLTVVSWVHMDDWIDPVTLFTHMLDVTRDNYVTETLLGHALLERGRVSDAIPHFNEAVRVRPGYAMAQNDLGTALAKQQKYAEALQHFDLAVEQSPTLGAAHFNRALAFTELHRPEEALAEYKQSLRLNLPLDSRYVAAAAAGMILNNRGDSAGAEPYFFAAVATKPESAEAHKNLASALYNKGNLADAILQMREAIRLNPADADAANKLQIMNSKVQK